MMTLYNYRIRY